MVTPNLVEHGAQHFPGALHEASLAALEAVLDRLPVERVGVRLYGAAGLAELLTIGPAGAVARQLLGPDARPVRALLFDKSARTNWGLGWHQDRTIAVQGRVDAPGFGAWTRKHGVMHVEPPADLLARMVTLRLHLDAVDAGNAPLLVALGSHRLGRIPEPEVDSAVAQCDTIACHAARGDVWAYATPILHASDRAEVPRRRRVIHVDYSANDLPAGLAWAGI